MRAYLCGAMDHTADFGVGWRKQIGTWLKFRGVVVLDPTDKPIDIGVEDFENQGFRRKLKAEGRYDELTAAMKPIRGVDLRMVDIADFLVVNFDYNSKPTGTHEEIGLANREKKPVIMRFEQGKANASDWFYAMMPHQMFFDTWAQVHQYLEHIDSANQVETYRRWMFFDHERMTHV